MFNGTQYYEEAVGGARAPAKGAAPTDKNSAKRMDKGGGSVRSIEEAIEVIGADAREQVVGRVLGMTDGAEAEGTAGLIETGVAEGADEDAGRTRDAAAKARALEPMSQGRVTETAAVTDEIIGAGGRTTSRGTEAPEIVVPTTKGADTEAAVERTTDAAGTADAWGAMTEAAHTGGAVETTTEGADIAAPVERTTDAVGIADARGAMTDTGGAVETTTDGADRAGAARRTSFCAAIAGSTIGASAAAMAAESAAADDITGGRMMAVEIAGGARITGAE